MLVYTIFLVLLVIVAVLLVAIILIQSGEGGISTSIGGASQLNSVFGAQTPAIMIKITTTVAIIFGVLIIGLNAYAAFRTSQEEGSELIRHVEQQGVRSLDLYGDDAPASTEDILSGAQEEPQTLQSPDAIGVDELMKMQEVVPQMEETPAQEVAPAEVGLPPSGQEGTAE